MARCTSSSPMVSGAKSGSSSTEASARCMRAVVSPSRSMAGKNSPAMRRTASRPVTVSGSAALRLAALK
jgi:hypothetical protein